MNLDLIEPKYSFCQRTKKEVTRLVFVHKLYMCNDCCDDCMKLMSDDTELGDLTPITGKPDGEAS